MVYRKTIIFDLFGVLFTIPFWYQLKSIGSSLGYFLLKGEKLSSFRNRFLDFLLSIPLTKTQMQLYQNINHNSYALNKPMPPLIALWQAGLIDYKEALETALEYLNLQTIDRNQKQLLRKALNITFNFTTRKQAYKPNKNGIALLNLYANKLDKSGNKKYNVYLLSNMDKVMLDYLEETYKEIFSKFDGITISGKTHSLKPDIKIFETLICSYNIDRANSILIDDQIENIEAAQCYGLKGILYDNYKQTLQKLLQLGFD